MIEEIEFVHYGSQSYDINKFNPITNSYFMNKPHGGLWASPVNSKFSWKSWCDTNYLDCDNFKFKIKKDYKVLIIDDCNDLNDLYGNSINMFLDFETLSYFFDAIYLTANGLGKTNMSHPHSLYGWDCESLLVMNRNALSVVFSGDDW